MVLRSLCNSSLQRGWACTSSKLAWTARCFLSIWPFWLSGTFSLVKTHYQIWQTLPISCLSCRDFSSSEEAATQTYSNQKHLWARALTPQSQPKQIVLLADKGQGLSINFDLVNGRVTVDRSPGCSDWNSTPKNLVRLVLAHIITNHSTATIFIDKSVFLRIFINKEKYLRVIDGTHMRIKTVSWSSLEKPTGTYYELDYGRKLTDVIKLQASAPLPSHGSSIWKNHSQVNEAMRARLQAQQFSS